MIQEELAKPAAKELLVFHAHETILRDKSKSLGQEGGEMKLYRIASPGSSPALMKLEREEGKPVANITIGESGRGRTQAIIPIIGKGSKVQVKKTDEGVVLVRGEWNDEGRCMAVINAVGSYDRYRLYKINDAQGVQTIASGTIAFGQAGRTNMGEEALAILSPGAEFRLNSKFASTWYKWTGKEWIVETPLERVARLTLQEIEQGGAIGYENYTHSPHPPR